MTNVRTCPPCNGRCNQGRECPGMPFLQTNSDIDPALLAKLIIGPRKIFVEPEAEQRPVPGAGVVLAIVLAVPAWVLSVALAAALLPPAVLAKLAGWLA